MAERRFSTTSPLITVSAVAAAAGFMIATAPAQALPPAPLAPGACAQWAIPSGTVTVDQSSGEPITFTGSGGATVTSRATWHRPNGLAPKQGSIEASISPEGEVKLFYFEPDFRKHYSGNVNADQKRAAGERLPDGVGWTMDVTCSAVASAPVEAPKPEGAPKQGPTVTPKEGLAGVTFTVTDRSGVASQCTYSSEGFTKSFGLPANGTVDVAVPAVRLFKNRTGTITCDNGTSTNTSVFF